MAAMGVVAIPSLLYYAINGWFQIVGAVFCSSRNYFYITGAMNAGALCKRINLMFIFLLPINLLTLRNNLKSCAQILANFWKICDTFGEKFWLSKEIWTKFNSNHQQSRILMKMNDSIMIMMKMRKFLI